MTKQELLEYLTPTTLEEMYKDLDEAQFDLLNRVNRDNFPEFSSKYCKLTDAIQQINQQYENTTGKILPVINWESKTKSTIENKRIFEDDEWMYALGVGKTNRRTRKEVLSHFGWPHRGAATQELNDLVKKGIVKHDLDDLYFLPDPFYGED